MQFDSKIAIVIRTDLEAWQKLDVASFLAGGIEQVFLPASASLTRMGPQPSIFPLIGQPILIFTAPIVLRSRVRWNGRWHAT